MTGNADPRETTLPSRLLVLVFYLIVLLSLTRDSVSAPSDERLPNIVLIISDDHAYGDFGFMGNHVVQTPNLDQLAAQSARYVNAYVPTSVCRPSLATLLTGLYPHQHGVHFNHPPPGLAAMRKMTANEYRQCRARAASLIGVLPTLPRVLAARGYACLQTGKHWEGDYRNVGFTHGLTTGMPTDPPDYGTRQQANGQWVAHGNGDAGLDIGRDTMQPIYEFIDGHMDQPFFVWYAPFLPHTPHDAPQGYIEKYADRTDVPEHLIGYYANISRFDDTVGELIAYLQQKQLARNTVFVLISDNGYLPAQSVRRDSVNAPHDKRTKWSAYENGIRTPLLIRWDGRVQPTTHRQLVQAVDVVPTLLAAAGLSEAVPDLPGIDLLPSATGTNPLPDRAAFGEIYPNDASTLGDPARDLLLRWVRHGDWKLIVPRVASSKNRGELFNLANDPGEQTNLAYTPQYAPIIQELRRSVDNWWTP